MKQYLEAGRLGAPRGVKGEVRFDCWCDSPEFLIGVPSLYLDENGTKALKVKVYRPSVSSFIFEGYEDRGLAATLTNRTVYFNRDDIELEDGCFFNDDLISLPVYNDETGEYIGILERIDETSRSYLYYVRGEKNNYCIPYCDEFIKHISADCIRVKLIEGLESD
jgi:16S rRNA processing protein RimM